ncbi:unnamed protein product [Rhodiola kirilowii]
MANFCVVFKVRLISLSCEIDNGCVNGVPEKGRDWHPVGDTKISALRSHQAMDPK